MMQNWNMQNSLSCHNELPCAVLSIVLCVDLRVHVWRCHANTLERKTVLNKVLGMKLKPPIMKQWAEQFRKL